MTTDTANPIAPNVEANSNLGNQSFNAAADPQQFGNGLVVLGNVTMHGATQTPYATLADERLRCQGRRARSVLTPARGRLAPGRIVAYNVPCPPGGAGPVSRPVTVTASR